MLVDQEQDERETENPHDASACGQGRSRDVCESRRAASEGSCPLPRFLGNRGSRRVSLGRASHWTLSDLHRQRGLVPFKESSKLSPIFASNAHT